MKPVTTMFPANLLRAALLFAPKADVRPYLNGVYIDTGRMRAVATDGHRMLVAALPVNVATDLHGLRSFIIPRADVEAALRVVGLKAPGVLLQVLQPLEGRTELTLSNLTTQSVDGKFPEWERILPTTNVEMPEQVNANPEFLRDGYTALAMIAGSHSPKTSVRADVYPGENGGPIIMAEEKVRAVVVIMPMRMTRNMRTRSEAVAAAFAVESPAP